MKKAIYPGSFDPVTLGHLDVIRRASQLFDHLVIAVLHNSAKTPLFSVEERVKMLEEATKDIPNFVGIDVDIVAAIAEDQGFEYELQIAQLNRVIAPDIDTVFLTTNLKYAYLSSSSVKEVAAYGGDISNFVTAGVAEEVHKKFQNKIRGKE